MNESYQKLISFGALIALSGFILSGPVGYFMVQLIKPQEPWTSVTVFINHYSQVQNIPYYFGFLLIGGMLMLVAGHYLNYNEQNEKTKFHLLLSLAWTIIFSTLVVFNYICQTTFIHNLATHYKPEYELAIAMFSMSNPLSLCWANEMWGYGFLGIATILMSSYYQHKSNPIYGLLILNGIISLLSVAWTIIDINWVMSTLGLILYFAWNLLMIVIIIRIYYYSNKKAH